MVTDLRSAFDEATCPNNLCHAPNTGEGHHKRHHWPAVHENILGNTANAGSQSCTTCQGGQYPQSKVSDRCPVYWSVKPLKTQVSLLQHLGDCMR